MIKIDKLLQEFRNFENRWVNENTLMAFWEVGNILIQRRFDPGSSVSVSKLLTDVASFGPNSFKKEEFIVMYKFAKLIPDKYQAFRISQLIGWYHLKDLLQLEDRRAIFYYAKLAATEGLGAVMLKTRVQNSCFERSEESKMSEGQFMKKMISVSEETQEYKKGNSIFTNKTIWLDFGDNLDSTLSVKNIFKAPYLKFLQYYGNST